MAATRYQHEIGRALAEAHRAALSGTVLAPTALAHNSEPELISLRQQHHPQGRTLPLHQRQMHGVFPGALQKILGAIKGVENPEPLSR